MLRQAGYSSKEALKFNILTSSTILIGSIGGYFLLGSFRQLEVPILGIATGALLAVLLQDLIPHSLKNARQKECFQGHIVAIALGLILMSGVVQFTSRFHSHNINDINSEILVLTKTSVQ